MGTYRIEVSPNNRAVCKNKECKDAAIKISKGQIRFGSWVSGPEFQSWSWKHWGCVTPKQIANLKDAIDDDATELDGYEDLLEDFQDKVRMAVQEGHVADEDWGGDVEMNREGMNGFRTPASKKAKKEALKEAESPSPSKPSKKKRGHVKADPDAEGSEPNDPAPKKRKTAVKKERNVKYEAAAGRSDDVDQPAKRGRKKAVKVEAEADLDGGDKDAMVEPPVNKARAPRKAAAAKKIKYEETASEDFSDGRKTISLSPVKPTRASRRPTAAKKVTLEDDDIDEPSEVNNAAPAKKTRAPRKATAAKKIKAENANNDLAGDEAVSAAPVPVKKVITGRKGKKIKIEDDNATTADDEPAQPASEVQGTTSMAEAEEDIDTDDSSKADSEATKSAPKTKQRGRKPVTKSINGTVASTAKKVNGKSHQTEA